MPLATEENLKEQIEIKIEELFNMAFENKALILTETDLHCQLFKKLYEIEYLSELSPTADEAGFITNKIHTEISWYDDNDILSIRPDLTLLLPENLKIASGFQGMPLPSKGLHSVDGGIIFELKYDRELHTISNAHTMDGIFKDIRNFKRVLDRFTNDGNSNEIYGYFILVIKSNENNPRNMEKINLINNELLERGLDQTKCKFLYKFINTI